VLSKQLSEAHLEDMSNKLEKYYLELTPEVLGFPDSLEKSTKRFLMALQEETRLFKQGKD